MCCGCFNRREDGHPTISIRDRRENKHRLKCSLIAAAAVAPAATTEHSPGCVRTTGHCARATAWLRPVAGCGRPDGARSRCAASSGSRSPRAAAASRPPPHSPRSRPRAAGSSPSRMGGGSRKFMVIPSG